MIPIEIIQRAGVLRTSLQRGSINLIELENFFTLVLRSGVAPAGKKADERFAQQMENLERGRARKPKK